MTDSHTVKTEVVEVSPEIALEWLEYNFQNRNLNRHHVFSLARAMADGDWYLNGQSISFDSTGKLQDGQHRLTAVVKSGKTVPMLVVRGVNPEARATVDVGRKRLVADELQMRGESQGRLVAAALMIMKRVDGHRGAGGNVVLTSLEAVEMLNEYPEMRSAVDIAKRLERHVSLPGSVIAYATTHFLRAAPDAVEEFWDAFITGRFEGQHDPRFVLQKTTARLAANPNFSSGAFTNKKFLAAITIKAWNAYRENREISVLRMAKGEKFPTVV